ncbi:MAG: PIN domain-containing protein [Desulfomicrobium escambiense]|nr:PIN domain-containing protein [Desulfomicrobium escambiense]
MSAETFLDTNVFLYNLDDSDPHKHGIASRLIREALDTGNACTSYQVVQECLSAGLRKAHIPLDAERAMEYLDTVLVPLWHIMPSPSLYERAIAIQARWRYSFYDSLVIASALEAGCKRLLTEDLQDGQRIETLVIENPFI